jgi:integrase
MRPRNRRRAWVKIAAAAGLPKLRLHDIRHVHATLMVLQGIHPKIVSERLGHTFVRITLDLYSHALPSLQAEAAAKMDGLLSRPVQRLVSNR